MPENMPDAATPAGDPRRSARTRVGTAVGLAAVLLALTSCGQATSDSAGATADTSAAQTEVAKYTGKPTAFPVDVALKRTFAADDTFVFLQCSSPVCALLGDLLGGAAQTMGVNLTVVKAGAAVGDQQSAANSVVALHPKGVLVAGVDPAAIGPQLKQLTGDGVAVTSMGLVDTGQYGIQTALTGDAQARIASLLADWTISTHGGDSDAVVYNIPELPFSTVVSKAYAARMKELCPDCKVRTVDVPVTEIGTKAPATVVSDLQRNPGTKVAMFTTLETAQGLPAALRTAGLTVDVIGNSPTPSNLEDLKTKGLAAAVGLDLPTLVWMGLDATARVASGQALTDIEKAGLPPYQLLRPEDITFDPSRGWSAYPDFAQRFQKLWQTP